MWAVDGPVAVTVMPMDDPVYPMTLGAQDTGVDLWLATTRGVLLTLAGGSGLPICMGTMGSMHPLRLQGSIPQVMCFLWNDLTGEALMIQAWTLGSLIQVGVVWRVDLLNLVVGTPVVGAGRPLGSVRGGPWLQV